MTTGATLEVRDVALTFGGITAIRSVSFTAQASELLAMVGPNGAGKTALLNCINGIYRPQAGDHPAGWRRHRRPADATGWRSSASAARSSTPSCFPHLTVVENLLIGRHAKFRAGLWAGGIYFGRARREEIEERRRVEAVIDFFELYRHRDTPVGALPFGIQKMVGVARALAMEPKLLLLDEPCTGLIREERENLARFLLRISHELGPTIVWVEHDMQMVSDLADRVVVLNHGAKIIEGTPDVVRQAPEVIAAYIGQAHV